MPFFSVIIPTYNRYESTKKAIESVIAQSFTDYELIVIDDGSTDSTPEIEKKYRGTLHYIRQENSGVSSARNTGIKHSCSPHIALLDSDDLWLPDKLLIQKKFIEQNPKIRIHQTDEIWVRNGKRVNPGIRHRKKSGKIFIDSLSLCLISPSSVILDRGLFDDYGYFDERLPACEDYDLWLRITANEEVGLVNEGHIIKHGGHADQLSRKHWGMDRFRVYSILKFLNNHSPGIDPIYINEAANIALKKCNVLLNGAKKRDRMKFSSNLKKIINLLGSGSYSKIDYLTLLEE